MRLILVGKKSLLYYVNKNYTHELTGFEEMKTKFAKLERYI